MNKILIQNPRIINEGRSFIGSVLVEGDKIAAVFEGEVPGNVRAEANQVIDATGKWLIPGVIDDQVHFRDPGLTHKGDIGTESRAWAVRDRDGRWSSRRACRRGRSSCRWRGRGRPRRLPRRGRA